MSKLVRRIIGEADGRPVNPGQIIKDRDAPTFLGNPNFVRDFILSDLARPEIEMRYEQVFAEKLALPNAQCHSDEKGPFTAIQILFDVPERSRLRLTDFYFIVRDVPREFHKRLVPSSALMEVTAGTAMLNFVLKPGN